jgi:hypothetical protein
MMTNIAGTNVTAPIVPYSETDRYPTHDANYGKGGYRAVANIAARQAIPYDRRTVGMIVRTNDTNINWILKVNTVDPAQAVWVEEVLDGGTF